MEENPYKSSITEAGEPARRPAIPLLGRLAIYGCIILLVVALLLPNVRSAREPARRNMCMNNMKQIVLALLAYETENGSFPPAYTVDAQGNRLHSWRTLILPYLEETELFETIDLTKPWDDPANAEAREALVEVYACPAATHEPTQTTYLGMVGDDCFFSGSTPRNLSEIADISATIAVIDATSEQAVHWMSPRDANAHTLLVYDDDSSTNHVGLILAGFVDGHLEIIPLNLAKDVRREMLSISEREPTAN